MKNLNSLWYYMGRCYEIALTGDLSITLVAHKDYPEAVDDYQMIKDFYTGVKFEENGDMLIEISRPDSQSLIYENRAETIEDIQQRVIATKERPLPSDVISETGLSLLNTAVSRLNLSLQEIEKIKRKALIIAWLDGKKNIGTEHVAEAIQISIPIEDACINLTKHTRQFSDKIQISLFDIDREHIENAIEYLQTRLK